MLKEKTVVIRQNIGNRTFIYYASYGCSFKNYLNIAPTPFTNQDQPSTFHEKKFFSTHSGKNLTVVVAPLLNF